MPCSRAAAAAAASTSPAQAAPTTEPFSSAAGPKLPPPETVGQEENRKNTGSFTPLVQTGREASALRPASWAPAGAGWRWTLLPACTRSRDPPP